MTSSLVRRNCGAVIAILGVGLATRLILEASLWQSGWFFGIESDAFSRTHLAWQWARHPYFSPGHWLPLQFYVVGSLYRLLGITTTSMVIPVLVGQACFVVSLVCLFDIADRLGGRLAAGIAVLLAATLKTDVWITLNALAEPLTVMSALMAMGLFAEWGRRPRDLRAPLAPLLGGSALVGSATHYVGWPIVLIVCLACVGEVAVIWRTRPQALAVLRFTVGFALAASFPIAWLATDFLRAGSILASLDRAAGYHVTFVQPYSFVDRAIGPLSIWVSNAPWLVGLGLLGLTMAIRRSGRPIAWSLLPGAGLLLGLEVSSLATWAMPYLYPRYSVVLSWVLIPFAGLFLARLVEARRALLVCASAILGALSLGTGIVGTFDYVNWVTSDTRRVAAYLATAFNADPPIERVVVESYGRWDDQDIDIVAGYPERFVFVAHGPDAETTYRALEDACRGRCLIVIRDLDTLYACRASVNLVFASGETMVVRPNAVGGLEAKVESTAASWRPMDETQFYMIIPPDQVVIGFSQSDPLQGETVAAMWSAPVAPGSCYQLEVEVRDYYGVDRYPGRIRQMLVVDGQTVWDHDISGDKSADWSRIEVKVLPARTILEVKALVLAVGTPEIGWDWGKASRFGLRGVALGPCRADVPVE